MIVAWANAMLATVFSIAVASAQTTWQRSNFENPLYAKSYDQFVLAGIYFTAPTNAAPSQPPILRVHCADGKFATGEFELGALADHAGTRSLKGAWQSRVDMRIGDQKKTEELWEYSNNGKTLFFDRTQLVHLLTGKMLGHPSRDALVKRVFLGVTEQSGNQILAQFDMPPDQSDIISACGLEWGRKR